MPRRRSLLRGPLDQVVVAASPRALGLPATPIDRIVASLGGFEPRVAVQAVAMLLHAVEHAGTDPVENVKFAEALLRPELHKRARQFLEDASDARHVLLAEQYVLIAGLYALRDSQIVGGYADVEKAMKTVAGCSVLLAEVHDGGDLLLEISRSALFASFQGWAHEAEEARALGRLLAAPHRSVPFDEHCRATFGVGIEEAWAMTAVFSTLGRDSSVYPWLVTAQTGGYSQTTLDAGARVWTQSIAEAVVRAADDLATPGWSFRAFRDRPIFEDGTDRLVAWRRALAEKARPFGLLDMAERAAKQQGVSGNTTRMELGKVLEERIVELLDLDGQRYPYLVEVITEDEQRRRYRGARFRDGQADWLLVERNFVVALEARHRPISLLAQATGVRTDLENDLDLAIIQKLKQCDVALANADAAGLLNGRRPFAVVVNSCPVPITVPLLRHVEDHLTPELVPFRQRVGYTYAVVELAELRMALRGARKRQDSLGRVFARWRDHPDLGGLSFYNWGTQHYKAATTKPSVEWLEVAAAVVLGPTPWHVPVG